jgi:hypothetical protein
MRKPPCRVCGQSLTGRRRTLCSERCATIWGKRPGAWGVVSGPKSGRQGARYRAATAQVRSRAQQGEACWFWGRDPHCPCPGFPWDAHHNHPLAFTAHHLDRLMDGGDPVPDPRLMVPAHRSCNARDGLRAQNERRMARATVAATYRQLYEATSRQW